MGLRMAESIVDDDETDKVVLSHNVRWGEKRRQSE